MDPLALLWLVVAAPLLGFLVAALYWVRRLTH